MKKLIYYLLEILAIIFLQNLITLQWALTIPQIILLDIVLFAIMNLVVAKTEFVLIYSNRDAAFIMMICIIIFALSHNFITNVVSADAIIELDAVGEKNPDSNSTEVWIAEINDGARKRSLQNIQLPTGWYLKDGLIYSMGEANSSALELHIKDKNNSKIVFFTHSWCGIVEIKCGEKTEKVDLYSESSKTEEVDLSMFLGDRQVRTVGNLLSGIGYIAFLYLMLLFVWALARCSSKRTLPYKAAIIHFIISFVTDKKFFVYDIREDWIRLIVYKLLFFSFLLIIWKLAFWLYDRVQQGDSRIKRLLTIFLIYFSVNMLLLILVWPGNWVWDEYFILEAARTLLNSEVWQHYITSVFYIMSLMLIPFPAGILVVQISLISALLSGALLMIEEKTKSSKFTYVLLAVFLFPPILRQNLYPIRLSIYAFVEFFYAVYIIRCKEQIFAEHKKCILTGMLAVLLAVWRSEGILILGISLAYCIIQYLRCKKNRRGICIWGLIMLTGTCILKIPQNILEEQSGRKYSYQLTSFIESFDDLIKKEYEEIPESEILHEIDEYIDVEMLVSMESGEDAFWNGAVRGEITKDSIRSLKSNYIKLVSNYPALFIKERMEFFLKSAGGKGEADNSPAYIYDTAVYNDMNHAVVRFRSQYDYNYPIDINVRQLLLFMINGGNMDGNNSVAYGIFYNVIFAAIAIIIFAFLSFKNLEWEKMYVCLIYLTQLAAIIVCAPGKYFMYYISFYIFGNTLIIYFVKGIIDSVKKMQNKEIK